MVRFNHVYKTYPGPVHALRNINFAIDKGSLVFLTGPSGAGKSTLFRLLSAFDRPTSGSVHVAGSDVDRIGNRQLPFFRRRIGVVFQDFKLLKQRPVYENVSLPLQVQGERPHLVKRRVDEIIEQVGLRHKVDELPDHLSGGEQQRVAIARALVHKPGVLIADEPTGNLDPQLSLEIMQLFDIANAQGTTVFIATHDLSLIDRKKHKVLKLEAGLLKEETCL
jgi:cell division transport system ATP-binding protein